MWAALHGGCLTQANLQKREIILRNRCVQLIWRHRPYIPTLPPSTPIMVYVPLCFRWKWCGLWPRCLYNSLTNQYGKRVKKKHTDIWIAALACTLWVYEIKQLQQWGRISCPWMSVFVATSILEKLKDYTIYILFWVSVFFIGIIGGNTNQFCKLQPFLCMTVMLHFIR